MDIIEILKDKRIVVGAFVTRDVLKSINAMFAENVELTEIILPMEVRASGNYDEHINPEGDEGKSNDVSE